MATGHHTHEDHPQDAISDERLEQLLSSGVLSPQASIRRDAEECSSPVPRTHPKCTLGKSILVGGIFGLLYSPLVGVVTLCIALWKVAHMKRGTMNNSQRWKFHVGCICAVFGIVLGVQGVRKTIDLANDPGLDLNRQDVAIEVFGRCLFGGLLTYR